MKTELILIPRETKYVQIQNFKLKNSRNLYEKFRRGKFWTGGSPPKLLPLSLYPCGKHAHLSHSEGVLF